MPKKNIRYTISLQPAPSESIHFFLQTSGLPSLDSCSVTLASRISVPEFSSLVRMLLGGIFPNVSSSASPIVYAGKLLFPHCL